LDESISQCSTYARSGAHEKDASVLERHLRWCSDNVVLSRELSSKQP
jgi:hypothetical protein